MHRASIPIMILIWLAIMTGTALAEGDIKGTFQITEDGKIVGAERYNISFESDGQVTTDSQGTLKRDQDVYKDYTKLILRTFSGPIHSYQREVYVNELPKELGATYQNGELLVEIRDGARKREKQIPIAPGTLVLETGVWHHYHLLLHRYSHRTGGEQKFSVVVPSELRTIDNVKVRHVAWEAVPMAQGYFMAHRYFIDRGDLGLTVWADKKGQILKIDVPLLNLIVETLNYKGERAAEASPVKVMGSSDLIYEPIMFNSGGYKLAGVITKPKGLAGRLPALVFISDNGPHDRDGNVPIANANVGTMDLMDGLSRGGFLALRTDDRGVGESQGDIARVSLSTKAADAAAALDLLKSRPDVDPNRLAVIGQGEGANVAIMVGAQRTDLRALLLLAPCDVPLSQLAEEQIKSRLKMEGNTDPEAWRASPIAVLMNIARTQPKQEFTTIGGRGAYLNVYREWFDMQPLEDLKKTKARILHLQGGLDLQVFPQHAAGFQKALAGDARYTFKAFPKLNHFFKPSSGSLAEYADPTLKVEEAFISYVGEWLKANL